LVSGAAQFMLHGRSMSAGVTSHTAFIDDHSAL
jgi:hypothetical protein